MNNTFLKVKVLFCWGFLVALLSGIYMPEFAKAAMPFVVCVAIAAAVMYSPDYMPALFRATTRTIKRLFPKATSPQATKITSGCVKAIWCTPIDYENYEIPAYARRGSAQ